LRVEYSGAMKPVAEMTAVQCIAGGKSYRGIAQRIHRYRDLIREIRHSGHSQATFFLSSIHSEPLEPWSAS
jgi:hypothetical protein